TSPESKRPRGAARREALLEAVLEIVAEVGAEAVTHRRVAERAQLPLASTTYWFDSKEELLTAALELAAQRDVARLHELADRLRERDPVQAVLDAVLDPLDEPSRRASLMASYALVLEAARRPAMQELARRWSDAYLETVGELLQRAGSARPREDARLILSAADGLLLEQLAAGDAEDPRPALARLVHILIGSRP
ncbi:MAG TPA: TetR family transcriptional regulator, partial [Solirubrobacteraceae bacterium]|nr:TetR family transcriptional regulator [Solirubrobacteraceae bacterium]